MAHLNTQSASPLITDEHILVVKRDVLFFDSSWNGCKQVPFDTYLTIIQQHKEFLPRTIMEADPTYKQIIPYLIFTHNQQYFLMQRKNKPSEQRLSNKFTLGIGGHIREEDTLPLDGTKNSAHMIFNWAIREFHEEVAYNGNFTIEPLCLINDDTTDVGKVHIGFAFLLRGTSGQIAIKSELQSGYLATLEECQAQKKSMEPWSKMVFDLLTK